MDLNHARLPIPPLRHGEGAGDERPSDLSGHAIFTLACKWIVTHGSALSNPRLGKIVARKSIPSGHAGTLQGSQIASALLRKAPLADYILAYRFHAEEFFILPHGKVLWGTRSHQTFCQDFPRSCPQIAFMYVRRKFHV
jgi:hypothetical protein